MKIMKYLALESSTSSAKALLYDAETKQLTVRTREYPQMHEDATLHSAESVYEQTMAVGKELLNGETDIAMIALGGTWHSLCLFDAKMNPQSPVYPWCYTEASDLCRELREDKAYVEEYYHKTGCMVNAIYPFFKLKMLLRQGCELKNGFIGGQGVYNTWKMTGHRVVTECTASGTGLLNIHKKCYEPSLLEELGISEALLPEIVPYQQTFPLIKDAAERLGLPEGIPVIPSNSDGGLNQIGVGALKKGVMTFSIGTSGAIRLTTFKPVLPDLPGTWCYLSPKSWLSGAATSGACNCIDWFKRSFAGSMSYEELERGSRPDKNLPIFLPFVFGERCPGWNDDRRGAFENLHTGHAVPDLYRAVQEGILFNLYQCYQHLVSVNEVPERIKLSGGILNSPLWTQMCADIFGKEMEVDPQSQSSLMGGIVLAMELNGQMEEAESLIIHPSTVIHPNPELKQFYKKRYEMYMGFYRG